MLFETTRYNYIFILSLWAFTWVLHWLLNYVPSLDMTNPGTPPYFVTILPTIMYSIFGVYIGICLSVLTYNSLGPKLIKSAKNLTIYGIRSFGTLVLVFADLVSFIGEEHDFGMRVFHLGNSMPILQETFIIAGFPILGLFLTWNLRNSKLEYQNRYIENNTKK